MDEIVADAILGFWQEIEYLQPSPAPDVNPRNRCWNGERDGDYPWQDSAKRAQLPETEQNTWRFTLYAGLIDMKATIESLRSLLAIREQLDGEFRASKPSAVLAVPVDNLGRVTGDISVGSLAWAMGRIQAAEGGRPTFVGFKDFENELKVKAKELLLARAALSPAYAERIQANPDFACLKVIEHGDIRDLLSLTLAECGWEPPRMSWSSRVQASSVSRRQQTTQLDDVVILNSFIAEDIDRVRSAVLKRDYGTGLKDYLFGTTEAIQDLRQQPFLAYRYLWPKGFASGRWPSEHPLVFAQQLAVNATFNRLLTAPGIFSVNGPPGTGKTTLLRDVVAGLVVERAKVLAKFEKPDDAFGPRQQVIGEEYGFFKLEPKLTGFGIVVASSNNGAVENVTKELPARSAISFPPDEMPDYFSAVAESVISDGDSREVGTCWGLMGAVLGSKERRAKFSKRFWNTDPPEEPRADALISFKTAILEMRDTAQSWEDAKEAFTATLREVEAEKKAVHKHAREVFSWHEVAEELRRYERDFSEATSSLNRFQADEEAASQKAVLLARDSERSDVRFQAARLYRRAYARLADLNDAAPEAREDVLDSIADAEREIRQSERDFRVVLSDLNSIAPPSIVDKIFRRAHLLAREAARQHLQRDLERHRDRLTLLENQLSSSTKALRQIDDWMTQVREANADLEIAKATCRNGGVEVNADLEALEHLNSVARHKASDAEAVAAETRLQRATAESNVSAIARKLEERRATLASLGETLAKNRFWDEQGEWSLYTLSDDERQLKPPWRSKHLLDIRARLFLAALDLHKAFAIHAGGRLRANLALFARLLSGSISGRQLGDGGRSLWETFFLIVPVVSTTFASFDRLFSNFGRETLGWLIVDEAGQATPQAALGAIWRAKRTLVVGDPQQLEPILSLPKEAVHILRTHSGVDPKWDPAFNSAQILADRANPIGMWIAKQGGSPRDKDDSDGEGEHVWVGNPLRVHRRCENPMFKLANRIAYNGLMVFGTLTPGGDENRWLGESCWLDMSPHGADGHWVPSQGAAAVSIVRQITSIEGGLRQADGSSNVFVITPFRTVRDNAQKLLAREYDWKSAKDICGTIHAFQGREAQVVVLLLGGDPKLPGAISDFAAAKPNLLNVALTRAKRRIYVVGSREQWKGHPYFCELAAELAVKEYDDLFARYADSGNDQHSIAHLQC